MRYRFLLTGIFLIWAFVLHAQLKSTNYLQGIRKNDVSNCWFNETNDTISLEKQTMLPEPIGFIGEQYQRFFIHYITITKSLTNPYQYHVTGKTKVKENICDFSGTISIVKAEIYAKQLDNRYRQGLAECTVDFKEDARLVATGFIKGKLTTKFYLDEKGNAQYDDLLFGADLYFNNQCEASWTSYSSKKTKKVNWGDYRIPGNTGFDIGDGGFMIADKYVNNGWQNYKRSTGDDPEDEATKKAIQSEAQLWWK